MMGDGYIDFAPIGRAVAAAGYTGDIEVEIFNADIWADRPGDEVLATMKDPGRDRGDHPAERPLPRGCGDGHPVNGRSHAGVVMAIL